MQTGRGRVWLSPGTVVAKCGMSEDTGREMVGTKLGWFGMVEAKSGMCAIMLEMGWDKSSIVGLSQV
jgi:hypothetical protein